MTEFSDVYELKVLGGNRLEGPDGPLTGPVVRRHPLALLALLAAHSGGQLSRDKIIGYLWPETSGSRARSRLRVVLHSIRRGLGAGSVLSVGNDLRLDRKVVRADVRDFRKRLEDERLDEAVRLYGGPFLDGFYLNGPGVFERWAESERQRLAGAYEDALRSLARDARERSEMRDAAKWWGRIAAQRPLDAEVARRYGEALTSAGDPGRAVQHLHRFVERLRGELGGEPPLEIAALLARLTNGPRTDTAGRESPEPEPPVARRASIPRNIGTPDTEGPNPEKESPDEVPGHPSPLRTKGPIRTMGAATAAVLLVIAAGLALGPREEASGTSSMIEQRVAVAPFSDQTGDPDLAALGPMAADWIAEELIGTGLVQVVPLVKSKMVPDGRQENRGASEEARRNAARRAGAEYFVTGGVYPGEVGPRLMARIIDLRSGRLLRTIRVTGAADSNHTRMVEDLRRQTAGALATVMDERLATWAQVASHPPSYRAYRLFSRGLDRFLERGRENYVVAADMFERAAALDSGFTASLVWAARARRWGVDHAGADSILRAIAHLREDMPRWDRAMFDYESASVRGDRDGAHRALEGLIRDVRSPDWIIQTAAAAYFANRPARAIELLHELDPDEALGAGEVLSYWSLLTLAHHRLGEFEIEMEVARRWSSRSPEAARRAEMRALAAVGRLPDLHWILREEMERDIAAASRARLLMTLAQELAAHGHREAMSPLLELAVEVTDDVPAGDRAARAVRARSLLHLGRLERSRKIYEQLAADAEGWAYLGPLGVIAAHQGDPDAAAAYSKAIADRRTSWDYGEGTLWRASIAAAGGEREQALDLLRQALREGLAHHRQIHTMVGLVTLRDDPTYRALLLPRDRSLTRASGPARHPASYNASGSS